MKKMILLLILPLTASMAIDFTMTKEGLFVESTSTTQPPTSGMAPETSNPYLEPVNLPKCDANNPEVQFIRSTADWNTINSSSKRIFCVSPGDYTSLRNISLTTSGTVQKKRYIILNNGNDSHPGTLKTSQLANFKFTLSGASYWTIDRAACFGDSHFHRVFTIGENSTHNIINRAFTDNVINSVYITNNANNNTIQKSRFQNMSHQGRKDDNPAIIFHASGTTFDIKNTKIILNEIYNAGDGIMTMVYHNNGLDNPYQVGNGEGTIIDSNDIYIDSNIYTDGKGNYTPNGIRAYAENAIDLKFGSQNAANPMIITNNHMWGYRKSDSTNSYLSDHGYAFVAHYGIPNIKFNNNLIYDSNAGIGVSDKQDAKYAMWDSEFKNNIIYSCGTIPGTGGDYRSIIIGSSNTITVQDNIIIDARNAYMKYSYNSTGMRVTNNIGINSPTAMLLEGNTGGIYSPNENSFTTGAEIEYTEDYIFTTDKYTNSPRKITIKDAVKGN